ncbi:MAG: zinc ribbon domain-containing protein [Candidatus Lokiarchaeota archaeon]|nr:zinc ribbon domain-containing protein [Candidatus Lokiarchaeota archaeon]
MKKYTWAFPFTAGIITIIGVLTPVAFSGSYFSIWMWGLIYSRLSINPIDFMNEQVFLLTGISASIIITTLALILIITGYLYRKGYLAERNLGKLWAITGCFIFAATIISLVSLEYYTYEGNFPFGVWDFLNAGFGAMGPIVGSILAIGIGIYVSVTEREKRNRKKIVPISAIAPKNICPHCGKPVSLNASFCSKCGKTIENNVR